MTRTLTLKSLDIPSIQKFGIGFDRMLNEILRADNQSNNQYPPYNIISEGEDNFIIELAVAGFAKEELKVEVDNKLLIISGKHDIIEDNDKLVYRHNGISRRAFDRQFNLADYVEVVDVKLKNGILSVFLERKIPEAVKPKSIEIKYEA